RDFKALGQQPQGAACPAIDGLIDEANEAAGEVDDKAVLDAAIVGSAQAVEHYESPLWYTDRLGGRARPRRLVRSSQQISTKKKGPTARDTTTGAPKPL